MVKIKPTCLLKGKNLNSIEIFKLTNIIFDKIEKKGKVVFYRISAKGNLKYNADYFEYIIAFTKFIYKNKKRLSKLNYDKIILDLEINYKYQCNLEFNKNILELINKTFDDLYLSCYNLHDN